ncbi:methyltransferase domain-containing protein [Candidatus Bandiella numerosa]|uniref:methyltransferase domain-containing protein n=1 Tax=Candidatus Bandiella numerosa TaxID=2570586 RepID=UPI001F46CC17|nr:methyltransferase domain-containing protein [Candidatus Bandiella numerosa]
MSIFKKIKNFFNPLLSLKVGDLKFWIDKLKSIVNEIKVKSKNLSKTNYDLGLFHFNRGNLNDAILRFRLLKRFEENYSDLDYLLGRCYFEKSRFEKAKQYLEDYVKNDDKFKEEAEYCLNIINDKNGKIQCVPIKIVDHKINQEFRFHLSEFQKCRKSSESATYDELKKILNDAEKVFNFNVLDLGCHTGLLTYLLRKNKLINFALGVDLNESAVKHCESLSIGKNKVYNTVIKKDIISFLSSKSKTDSKFDIILGVDLISYSTEIESILSKLKSYLNEQGIFLLTFRCNNTQKDNYIFDGKSEQFIYNSVFINKLAKKCGWIIAKEEFSEVKKHEYSQATLILKINHEHTS